MMREPAVFTVDVLLSEPWHLVTCMGEGPYRGICTVEASSSAQAEWVIRLERPLLCEGKGFDVLRAVPRYDDGAPVRVLARGDVTVCSITAEQQNTSPTARDGSVDLIGVLTGVTEARPAL